MTVEVNGESRDVADGTTVVGLLDLLGLPHRAMAIAVDGEVCPRGAWTTPLPDGAVVDILTAVQGG